MPTSWTKQVNQYKSPLRVIASILLRSREYQAHRARQQREEVQRLEKIIEKQEKVIAKALKLGASKDEEIARLRNDNERLRRQPPTLPDDPKLPNHESSVDVLSTRTWFSVNSSTLIPSIPASPAS